MSALVLKGTLQNSDVYDACVERMRECMPRNVSRDEEFSSLRHADKTTYQFLVNRGSVHLKENVLVRFCSDTREFFESCQQRSGASYGFEVNAIAATIRLDVERERVDVRMFVHGPKLPSPNQFNGQHGGGNDGLRTQASLELRSLKANTPRVKKHKDGFYDLCKIKSIVLADDITDIYIYEKDEKCFEQIDPPSAELAQGLHNATLDNNYDEFVHWYELGKKHSYPPTAQWFSGRADYRSFYQIGSFPWTPIEASKKYPSYNLDDFSYSKLKPLIDTIKNLLTQPQTIAIFGPPGISKSVLVALASNQYIKISSVDALKGMQWFQIRGINYNILMDDFTDWTHTGSLELQATDLNALLESLPSEYLSVEITARHKNVYMDPSKSKIVIANYDNPVYKMYTEGVSIAKGRIKKVFDLKEMGLCNEWPDAVKKQEYMEWCETQPGGRGEGGCDYIPLHNKHPFAWAPWNPLYEPGVDTAQRRNAVVAELD